MLLEVFFKHSQHFTRTASCIRVTLCPTALTSLEPTNRGRTDVKPDNVLINYGDNSARFSEVQLGDGGDACRFSPEANPLEEGHVIGAAIFRSPEAMLNLRWGPPTDIWSLGTTVRS